MDSRDPFELRAPVKIRERLPPMILETTAADEGAVRLRIKFQRSNDRLSTAVWALDDENVLPLMCSVEGGSRADWPESPPLQNAQQIPQHPDCVLATGMAGTSHWSAAVEIRQNPDWGHVIDWDVACRATKKPIYLGSRFQLADDAHATHLPNAIVIDVHGHSFRLQPRTTAADEDSTCQVSLDVDAATCGVFPVDSENESLPRTIRWAFQLFLIQQ